MPSVNNYDWQGSVPSVNNYDWQGSVPSVNNYDWQGSVPSVNNYDWQGSVPSVNNYIQEEVDGLCVFRCVTHCTAGDLMSSSVPCAGVPSWLLIETWGGNMFVSYCSCPDHANCSPVLYRVGLDQCTYYQVAHDTALGINYLHRHRPCVLHLDLKALNILLNNHLRAKIADFGFAKLR